MALRKPHPRTRLAWDGVATLPGSERAFGEASHRGKRASTRGIRAQKCALKRAVKKPESGHFHGRSSGKFAALPTKGRNPTAFDREAPPSIAVALVLLARVDPRQRFSERSVDLWAHAPHCFDCGGVLPREVVGRFFVEVRP